MCSHRSRVLLLAGTLCFDLWVFLCEMMEYELVVSNLSSGVEIGYENSGIHEAKRLNVLVGSLFLDCELRRNVEDWMIDSRCYGKVVIDFWKVYYMFEEDRNLV